MLSTSRSCDICDTNISTNYFSCLNCVNIDFCFNCFINKKYITSSNIVGHQDSHLLVFMDGSAAQRKALLKNMENSFIESDIDGECNMNEQVPPTPYNSPQQNHIVAKKPVIYLYNNTNETIQANIKITLHNKSEEGNKKKNEFLYFYPPFDFVDVECTTGVWSDVEIVPSKNKIEQKYPYLFWEATTSRSNANIIWDNFKFIVADKYSLTEMIELVLQKYGLNSREIADFITFWVPLMISKNSEYIGFQVSTSLEQQNVPDLISELKITPKPDNVFRIYLIFKTFNEKPQQQTTLEDLVKHISPITRKGFHVIEWGGIDFSEE